MAAPRLCRYWLVDDDDKQLELQRDFLQCHVHLLCLGCQRSADAALAELAKAEHPDLILMDVNMPGTSGIEAIPLVRALAPEVRIIIHSAFTNPMDRRAALAAGASGYLSKSISPEALVIAMDQAMSRPIPVLPSAPQPAASSLVAPRRNWLRTLQAGLLIVVRR